MLANQKAQITGAAMGVVDSVGQSAMGSDRRLKKDIKLIGISPSGFKYIFF